MSKILRLPPVLFKDLRELDEAAACLATQVEDIEVDQARAPPCACACRQFSCNGTLH